MRQPRCTPDQQLQLEPGLPRLSTDTVSRLHSAPSRLLVPCQWTFVFILHVVEAIPCRLFYKEICVRDMEPAGSGASTQCACIATWRENNTVADAASLLLRKRRING